MKSKHGGLYKWFSICSMHFEHKEDCGMCNTGSWVFMPFHYVGRFVFWISPWLWRAWMNRGDVSKRFKNSFTDLKGDKKDPFPNV